MGRAFRHDFSRIRIHEGAAADRSAALVGARAYTVGRHIVFAAGQYSPSTTGGRVLLAHELAHAAQQRFVDPNASHALWRYAAEVMPPEREADMAARLAASGIPPGQLTTTEGAALARSPQTPTSPIGGPSAMPTLHGQTTRSFYNLRDAPDGKVLGTLEGRAATVTVVGKRQTGTGFWFEIILREPISSLQPGTHAWITSAGVVPTADWPYFMSQLRESEAAHTGLPLIPRITRLRQWSHASNLPFDRVIGTVPGTEYVDTRPSAPGQWQLLKDYQSVRVPDGTVVDLQHLLVGMDVLAHKVPHQTFGERGSYAAYRLGPNYSAATWAGDIGAAVADMTLKQDSDWESRNVGATIEHRLTHYYDSRVSQADMLGDIDAWGVREKGASKPGSIVQLLSAYYGRLEPSGTTGAQLNSLRESAIANFLHAYGFRFDYSKHQYPRTLTGQKAAYQWMKEQIRLFTRVWIMFRGRVPALL